MYYDLQEGHKEIGAFVVPGDSYRMLPDEGVCQQTILL